jgi:hypothetical protein
MPSPMSIARVAERGQDVPAGDCWTGELYAKSGSSYTNPATGRRKWLWQNRRTTRSLQLTRVLVAVRLPVCAAYPADGRAAKGVFNCGQDPPRSLARPQNLRGRPERRPPAERQALRLRNHERQAGQDQGPRLFNADRAPARTPALGSSRPASSGAGQRCL